jgi:hypothetical protein
MHVERLRILQQHLVQLSRTPIAKRPRAFNMTTWFSRKPEKCNEFCGTAACALGEAGLIPALRKEGLKTNRRTHKVTFEDEVNLHAGQYFFELDFNQAANLFNPWRYLSPDQCRTRDREDRFSRKITPLAVAKRINALIMSA